VAKKWTGTGKVAKALGVDPTTVRRMEKKGEIVARKTPSGTRQYDVNSVKKAQQRKQGDEK